MSKSSKGKRLDAAVKTYRQRQQDGTLPQSPGLFPVPLSAYQATEDSPDLNEYDNVVPLSKHPRWRWHKS